MFFVFKPKDKKLSWSASNAGLYHTLSVIVVLAGFPVKLVVILSFFPSNLYAPVPL